MSDTPTPERRKGTPTDKMVTAAKNAAQRHGVELPAGYDKDFEVCKAFLDEYLSKPSPNALKYAQKIAVDKSIELPEAAKASAKDLSAWIDAHAPK